MSQNDKENIEFWEAAEDGELDKLKQELINNIIKHSNANQVNVQLFKADNNIILIVEDDGIGINKKKESKGETMLSTDKKRELMRNFGF